MKHRRKSQMVAAIAKEMHKQTDQFNALREIQFSDRDADAVLLYSKVICREKFDSTGAFTECSARLVPFGNNQPSDSYVSTYAPTADDPYKNCMVAANLADSVKHHYHLDIYDFDISGAFLQGHLDKSNFPRQILIKIQPDLPHHLAGKWVEVLKPVYGLKQSNNIFYHDFNEVMLSLGYKPTFDNVSIYVKTHPSDPKLRNTVSMHVDDGLGVCSHPPYRDELLAALTKRFGPLKYHAESTSYTGTHMTRHPSGATTLDMAGYIKRFIADLGLSKLPAVASPSTADLYWPSKDTRPCDPVLYRHITGGLLYMLKARHDIRQEATYLSSKNHNPTYGDLKKCIRVIAYLNTYPSLGPTYYTTEGAVLYGKIDSAFGVHSDGRSQSALCLSIGEHSAPFLTRAYRQRNCVSVSPMDAEYVVFSEVGKLIVSLRRFLADLGFPQQPHPTLVGEDNIPAINLAVAPAITGRSRHIFVRHHYIRDLIKLNIVKPYHLGTKEQSIDLLTKPHGPTSFWPLCKLLLNTAHNPNFKS